MGEPRPVALVTGANGFLGNRFVRRLAAQGFTVRALVRRADGEPGPRYGMRAGAVPDSIEVMEGDFVDSATAERASAGVAVVVHCAATAGPDLDPVRRVNVDGTRSVVEAARRARVPRFIHISTVSVYATAGLEVVDEEGPLQTEGLPYGRTKAEGDRIVLDAVIRGLPATILRPGAILGAHPTSTWAVKVPERIRDRVVKLKRDGGDTIPFVHVEDLIDAAIVAMERPSTIGRVYNLTDHHGTWRAYSDAVRGWFKTAPLEVLPEDDPASKAYWTGRYDAGRVRSELDYAPRRTYAEGMNEAKRYWEEASA